MFLNRAFHLAFKGEGGTTAKVVTNEGYNFDHIVTFPLGGRWRRALRGDE